MDLPVTPPVSPMLARPAAELPIAPGMIYEPKWDGFRAVVFRSGDEVEIGSRNERPLTRYFPELAGPLREQLPGRCVLDGEIVIAGADGRLDFEALLARIHPAASRVALLARTTPASFVAFDLLAAGDEDLRTVPFASRRARLAEVLAGARPPVHLTPATTDVSLAREWFSAGEGAGLDGIVAKSPDLPYREGERVMVKVKHTRTADCVVGGFRWHTSQNVIGSLLLGLYDDAGTLHHIGVASAFGVAQRRSLVAMLEPYRSGTDAHPWRAWRGTSGGARVPGAQSRWNAGRDLSFEPVRPELVVEIRYDHLQGDRLRHTGQFVRFRPDRGPRSCTYAQLDPGGSGVSPGDKAVPSELARVFGTA